jgi:DNA-binding NarL/FixJ family response regulator
MRALSILLADDHEVVRRGLRNLLEAEPGWTICGEARNGREAVEMARTHCPDVVVLDITMPELNGFEATRAIRKRCPGTEVLILTMHESEQVVREVMEAGARGYVLKSDAGRDLVDAIHSIAARIPFFTPKMAQRLAAPEMPPAARRGRKRRSASRLTAREREVVQLLAEGRSNREVAERLGISIKTVETHRSNIMSKLRLHSIGELVRYAVRNRMIQP